MIAQNARYLRLAGASFVSLVAALTLGGCGSAPAAAPGPTSAADEPSDHDATAYACGSLAGLSASLMNGDRSQGAVDASVTGLLSLTELGDDDVQVSIKEAQNAARLGITFNDYVSLVEPAALACRTAGFALTYSMAGG